MLTLAIQAGGESRRMGQNKALVLFLGKPLIQRAVERLTHLADEVLVTTNHPDELSFLGVRLVPDLLPGSGALGGLYTALNAAVHPLVAVVACDMPFANADLLVALRDRLLETGSAAAIPRSSGGLEPFHAVYRRETCLPPIQAALEAEKRRVDSWFAQVKIEFFTPETVRHFDPHQLTFLNVNTPEELQAAEQQARETPDL